jgi:hypothetical protein
MSRSALAFTALVAATVAWAGLATAQTTPPAAKPPASGATMPDSSQAPAKEINAATARTQIEASGYSKVKGLARQTDGTWRARATKNDQEVAVSVDATGKVSQMQQ